MEKDLDFEYLTEDETILYVTATVKVNPDNKIRAVMDLSVETERGIKASDRRYKEVSEYIFNSDRVQKIITDYFEARHA